MSLLDPSPEESPVPTPSSALHVLIIGAGLCGLAAAISTSLSGHKVTILEAASQLHEVGAGLQLTPNGTRLLHRWNIAKDLALKAAAPSTISIRRFDGKLLAHRNDYQQEIENRYGSPIWCLHRVDLQKSLADKATSLGAELRFGSRVKKIEFQNAAVTLESGEKVIGDVVLAADGLWSTSRIQFQNEPVMPKPTGDLAYRILLQADDIADPYLRSWVSKPGINIWIGPSMHIVAYSLLAGSMYNLVLLVPDDLPSDISKGQGDTGEIRKLFEQWDPILNRFLSQVQNVDKWRLNHIPSLDSWKTPQGNFAMAGDSCHAMLPYLAQGANSALEDGAVFGALLGKVKSRHQITPAMALYEKLRKGRVERIVAYTFLHRDEFHLDDGLAQRERDSLLAESFRPSEKEDQWMHPKIQPWLFSYDAYAEVEKAFATDPF